MEPLSERDIRDMRKYGKEVSGPIVYAFTEWVLERAVKLGIHRLWFLARDGYLPYLIARKICVLRGLRVECKYLYCSRKSLRSASYHLISDGEISAQLFTFGYYVSLDSFLARLDIGEQKRREIIRELGVKNPDVPLSRDEFSKICDRVSADREIFEIIRAHSKEKYSSAISYFESVGLTECDTVAIVDSGWTGSMQHSLKVLLDSLGYKGKLLGFYFGMYSDKDRSDGEHYTYYFSVEKGILRRAFFNNNLLECMLSAPHPMTEKYSFIAGVPRPCFEDFRGFDMHRMVLAQICGALDFTDTKIGKNKNNNTAEQNKRSIFEIVFRAMICPRRRDAQLFSKFLFCDDITEKYMHSLADENMLFELREYMIIPRIFHRIFKTPKAQKSLLWPYGVTAYLPWHLRLWYRGNLLAWDFIKSLRQGFTSIFRR